MKLCQQLNDDLVQLTLSFLFDATLPEIKRDADLYCYWHKTVPPIFIASQIYSKKYCTLVPSPFRHENPFIPTSYLLITPTHVWGFALYNFGSMLCHECIRGAKTYKRCAKRWIRHCSCCLNPRQYVELYHKLLSKLDSSHFHTGAPRAFVKEALTQIAFYKPENAA